MEQRGVHGGPAKVTAPGWAKPLEAQYRKFKLSEPITSHNEFAEPLQDFPQEAQTREVSPDHIKEIASTLRADDVIDRTNAGDSGPPVLTEWPAKSGKFIVVSGNHRWNAFKKAMRDFPQKWESVTKAFRDYASDYGFDPATIAGDEMVAKVIPTPGSLAELERIASDLNQKRVQEFTKRGDIANRATRVTPELAELVSRAMDRAGEGATVRGMLDSAEGPPLIRRMIADRLIPSEEKSKMIADNGLLTPEGKTAVLNGLTGRLLKGVKTTDKVIDNVLYSASALMRADEAVPRLKATEKIREAAQMVAESMGHDVASYFNQGRLDGRPRPSQNAIDLAVRLKAMGVIAFNNFIKETVNELAKHSDNPLFGEPPPAEFPTLTEKPMLRRLRSNPSTAEVRDQETGKWRPYDPAKDGPAPTMKDSASADYSDETLAGDGAKQDWMNKLSRERVTEAKKTPPPRDPTYNQIPPDNGWSEYVREFTPEEGITPDDTKPHEVHTAPLAETTDGYPRRTGLTSVLAEAGINAEDMKAKDLEQMGGTEMIDRLERMVESHPGAELILSKIVRNVSLDAAEKLVFDKAPAEFKKLGREFRNFLDMVRAHDIPLRDKAEALKAKAEALEPGDPKASEFRAEAENLESQCYAIGDLGPNYFPWRNLTWESVWKMAQRYGVEGAYERIKKGNLDYSREGVNEPMSNSVGTLKSYVHQVRTKMTGVQAAQKLKAAGETAKARKWITAEKIFKDFYESHIKRVSSMMDQAEFVKRLERMDRDPSYRAKFKDTVAMRSPVSEIVGWHNSVVAAMTVAFNLSSGLTAGVGNIWRVASEMGLKRFAKAAGKTLDYAASKAASKFSGVKLDPKMKALEEQVQRMAGLEDAELADITGQESGYELGGKLFSRVRKAAYQHVRIPDVIAKFIAVIDQLEAVKEENPSWSPRRVETAAAIRVAGMTDVSKGWSRAPVANNPIYKAMTLFAKSSIRETTQMLRQLNGGPSGWSKLAVNLGGRAATWALVYKLTQGHVDRDRVLQALGRVLPFSYLWENKAPPVGVLAQKAYKAATGEPEELLPSAVRQKGLRRLFKKEK